MEDYESKNQAAQIQQPTPILCKKAKQHRSSTVSKLLGGSDLPMNTFHRSDAGHRKLWSHYEHRLLLTKRDKIN